MSNDKLVWPTKTPRSMNLSDITTITTREAVARMLADELYETGEKSTMSETSTPNVNVITKAEAVEALKNAPDDEPVFILRAQDLLAAEIVREWVHRARAARVDPHKIVHAMNVADAMDEWEIKKRPD